MFCSIARNNTFYSINYINYLPSLRKTQSLIKNVYITNIKKYKQLQMITKTINHYSFTSPFMLYLEKIKLKTMDDITELANLAEEQEVCEKTEEFIMDFEEDFSESESESTDLKLDTNNIPLEKVPNKANQYQHSFHINRNYYKHIVGSKGEILKRLCSETKTTIRVSKKKKHVVIIGSVQKRIIHARNQIDKLIESSKNKLRFTHFISIPTNTKDMKDNFIKFKEDVLKHCEKETAGINENIFQKPEKLHLTICMLHLLEDTDQQKAIAALHNCKTEIIEPILKENGPLSMEFRGLKCMESNPSKAKVLYINVYEETGFLQKMTDAINDYFLHQNLSRKQHDSVTLHMTVMNTFYLKRKKQKPAKNTFDATNILKEHEKTHLGKLNLSTLHLSKLTAKSPDGYFEATSKIEF